MVTDHLSTSETFASLGVNEALVASLADQGIVSPFPIQALTLPEALDGLDIVGKAKTGSGKTLAFTLPLAQLLGEAQPKRPLGLVLVPTRELALQVTEVIEPLMKASGKSSITAYGGAPMKPQIDAIKNGVEVVVATPGRLIDLQERKAVDLADVEIVVLDEADEMANRGFLPQVKLLLRQIETNHQTLLFSATIDYRVDTLVDRYMEDPVWHEVESETDHVETSHHRFLLVHHMDKARVAARILSTSDRGLVFVRTKRGCDKVAALLRDVDVHAQAIHGDLPQRKRERILSGFASGSTPVLVATNVAARGLHIEGVGVVIHYDPPQDAKEYLHRSGRTARAGEEGLVVTFVEYNQETEVRVIQKEAGLLMEIEKMFSSDDRLDNLMSWEPEVIEDKPKPKRARRRSRNRI